MSYVCLEHTRPFTSDTIAERIGKTLMKSRAGQRQSHLNHHGGIRALMDFVKAMALGADGVAISNSAIQVIACVAVRMCNTNNCPSGIATQNPQLRRKLNVDKASAQIANFFNASVELMQIMTRACGHHLAQRDGTSFWNTLRGTDAIRLVERRLHSKVTTSS